MKRVLLTAAQVVPTSKKLMQISIIDDGEPELKADVWCGLDNVTLPAKPFLAAVQSLVDQIAALKR